MNLPDLPPPVPDKAVPLSSCSCALPPGQVSSFGWHFARLGKRGCYVHSKVRRDPETGAYRCFRGECNGVALRCVYEGQMIAVERCPAYMAAVVTSIAQRQRTDEDGEVVD